MATASQYYNSPSRDVSVSSNGTKYSEYPDSEYSAQLAAIPRYSTMNSVTVYMRWYTTSLPGGNIYLMLGDSQIYESTCQNYEQTITRDVTSYFNSDNASAGYPKVTPRAKLTMGILGRTVRVADFDITWNYTLPTYTIRATAGAGGTVSGNIGTYDVTTTDQVKTLTAHPNAGYRFVAWQNSSGAVISGNATLQVTISQYNISAHSTTETYTAVFETADNDLNYDNLFSFSGWAKGIANVGEGSGSGTVSTNKSNGEVTVSGNGDFYTAMSPTHYSVPVTVGETYIFRYDVTANGSSQVDNLVQAFVFFVDDNNGFYTDPNTGQWFANSYKGEHLAFTVPQGCKKVSFRVGVANNNVTAVFSNMALLKASVYDYEITNRQYRKVFTAGHEVGLLYVPEREGYVFQGWYTGENGTGTHIRKIDSLSVNTTVYSHWKKRDYYDVNYDNLFSFADWAHSPSGAVNGLGDSGGAGTIKTDLNNGTVTVTRTSGSGSFYTMYGSFSPYHRIPVVAGRRYIFKYSVNHTNNIQAFVLFCNDNQNFMTYPPTGFEFDYRFDGSHIDFTVPSGCTSVCFRLGVSGNTPAVFSNIGLYKVSDEQEITNRPIRKNIPYGSTVGTLSTPSREGYAFKGWYTGENGAGNKVSSSDIYTKGLTAYSAWNLNKIYVGNSPAKELYVGTTPVKAIYVGTTKVYER